MMCDLKKGEIQQLCVVVNETTLANHELPEGMEPKSARKERFVAKSWDEFASSNYPVLKLAQEFADVLPDKVPAALPADRGVRHKIDLVPGYNYCVTRQWPLPCDQVDAIDTFSEGQRLASQVRENVASHSSPTFCVRKRPDTIN